MPGPGTYEVNGRKYNKKDYTIIAEGDSWFSYQWNIANAQENLSDEEPFLPAGKDIIDWLRSSKYGGYGKGYDIENYSMAGDTLRNMIWGDRIEHILSRVEALQPKVFLFSGGGNDVSGQNFEKFLNDRLKEDTPVNEIALQNSVRDFEELLVKLIENVKEKCQHTKILMHGYAYGRPTGIPVASGLLPDAAVASTGVDFRGPWLKPGLDNKHITNPEERVYAVCRMTKVYNDMLMKLASDYSNNFHHVSLLNLIDPDTEWINEYHLTDTAFGKVAHKFHQAIQNAIGGNPFLF